MTGSGGALVTAAAQDAIVKLSWAAVEALQLEESFRKGLRTESQFADGLTVVLRDVVDCLATFQQARLYWQVPGGSVAPGGATPCVSAAGQGRAPRRHTRGNVVRLSPPTSGRGKGPASNETPGCAHRR